MGANGPYRPLTNMIDAAVLLPRSRCWQRHAAIEVPGWRLCGTKCEFAAAAPMSASVKVVKQSVLFGRWCGCSDGLKTTQAAMLQQPVSLHIALKRLIEHRFQRVTNLENQVKSLVIFAILAVAFSSNARADESYYKSLGACAANSIGTVYCAPPFGGALQDSIGTVLCGPGQCARDSIGTVYCSSVPGGGAEVDSIGTVYCTEGCTRGSASYCSRGNR